jgi:hypothetical protein
MCVCVCVCVCVCGLEYIGIACVSSGHTARAALQMPQVPCESPVSFVEVEV